jgi:hypothetical protein
VKEARGQRLPQAVFEQSEEFVRQEPEGIRDGSVASEYVEVEVKVEPRFDSLTLSLNLNLPQKLADFFSILLGHPKSTGGSVYSNGNRAI